MALVGRGERTERCRWQMKRGERVAAVEKIEEKRKPEDFFGHRNRNSQGTGGIFRLRKMEHCDLGFDDVAI